MSVTESYLNKFFGGLAKAARTTCGLSLAEVCTRARGHGYCIDPPLLSALENGKHRWTTVRMAAISSALGIPLWFLGGPSASRSAVA